MKAQLLGLRRFLAAGALMASSFATVSALAAPPTLDGIWTTIGIACMSGATVPAPIPYNALRIEGNKVTITMPYDGCALTIGPVEFSVTGDLLNQVSAEAWSVAACPTSEASAFDAGVVIAPDTKFELTATTLTTFETMTEQDQACPVGDTMATVYSRAK